MLRRFVCMVALLALAAGSAALDAQESASGRIQGKIVDSETGEPLVAAEVYLSGTQVGALSDLDGNYRLLDVASGVHALRVSYLGYAVKEVTGVQVVAGETATVDVGMVPEALLVEGVTVEVTAEAERGSVAGALETQRNAPNVLDAISAEQIARAPDTDAADALKRVTGLSVVDNKYVYVRGLGDRYGSTLLNGTPLPSPEPDRKVVPLDIFPARLLENVLVAKTYSPDHPGDFAGGLVQINTKQFPKDFTMELGVASSLNSQTAGDDFLTYAGGDLDFFGVDDGTRDLPSIIPDDRKVVLGNRFDPNPLTDADLESFGEAFANVWEPEAENGPLNQSFNLLIGDEVELGGKPLGFLASATYSNDHGSRAEVQRVLRTRAGEEGEQVLEERNDYTGDRSLFSVIWGGLANVSFRPAPTHKLSLNTVMNHTVEDEARTLDGFDADQGVDVRTTRLRFVERALFNTQLAGEHQLPFLFGSQLEWRGAYSTAKRDEPDNRETAYVEEPGTGRFRFRPITQSGSRFFSFLDDREYSGGLDWTVPFKQWSSLPARVKIGGLAQVKDRDFDTRRFRFQPQTSRAGFNPEILFLPPEQLFTAENIGPTGLQLEEFTRETDSYAAEQRIYAGYATLDVPITDRLRAVAGARVERSDQQVDPFDRFGGGLAPGGAKLETTDVLPGLNLTYSLGEDVNLRAAASQTIARPEFRELAPFEFSDYVGAQEVFGNPDLERTRIQNFDVRWEWFPGVGELVALSGFYKRFSDPIEQVIVPSSELGRSYANAKSARNYGAELEVRKGLGFLAAGLSKLSLGANLTLVESQVTLDSASGVQTSNERALQGQSPFVVNTNLSFTDPAWGLEAAVLYNVFGERIDQVGALALPDIVEEPRHQLDFVLEKNLLEVLSVKLSGRNVLNSAVEFTQGGEIVERYKTGSTYSLGLAYSR